MHYYFPHCYLSPKKKKKAKNKMKKHIMRTTKKIITKTFQSITTWLIQSILSVHLFLYYFLGSPEYIILLSFSVELKSFSTTRDLVFLFYFFPLNVKETSQSDLRQSSCWKKRAQNTNFFFPSFSFLFIDYIFFSPM